MKYQRWFKMIVLIFIILTSSACTLAEQIVKKSRSTSPPRTHVTHSSPSPTARPGEAVSLLDDGPPERGQTQIQLNMPEIVTPNVIVSPNLPIASRRIIATPTPRSNLMNILDSWWNGFNTATPTPRGQAMLPTFTPSPTPTGTATPTVTFTATPLPTITPPATATPLPTDTPLRPPPTDTPIPTDTPTPLPPPTNTPRPRLPTETPTSAPPTATPKPQYDFLLGEFYNSPTTNSFMVMYVAIVDVKNIPIGDMRVVGTREDYNLIYQSPLSTWFFEGYNAPGQVVKSGNVKFEPPSGLETTKWLIHLEDAHGNRMSDDIPFHTNQEDKQWYFVQFRRKF